MKCKVLIDYLKEFNPDQEIVLFDENSRPMQIEKVVIDSSNNGCFNHIVIKDVEVT
jgi:hypothetical protein